MTRHQPSRSNDLLSIWSAALSTSPSPTGMVVRAKFENPEAAKTAKIALYKLREKARIASRRSLGPDEPAYNTSPWDGFRIEHPGADRSGKGGSAELHIYTLGFSGLGFELLPLDPKAADP